MIARNVNIDCMPKEQHQVKQVGDIVDETHIYRTSTIRDDFLSSNQHIIAAETLQKVRAKKNYTQFLLACGVWFRQPIYEH
jgi:hypothetical protein